jgi:hypothetical protein
MADTAQPVNAKYHGIRAALIRRGSSIPRWAQEHNIPASTVYDAAKGARTGKNAKLILKKLEALIHD